MSDDLSEDRAGNVFGFDSEYLQSFFRMTGTGPREAFRALRPQGPFDRFRFLTHCLGCGVDKAKPVRWYWDCNFQCKCGGQFDVAALLCFNRHAALCLWLARSGAPAWQVAAVKEGMDRLDRIIFQPIQDAY